MIHGPTLSHTLSISLLTSQLINLRRLSSFFPFHAFFFVCLSRRSSIIAVVAHSMTHRVQSPSP